jgi:hypothetical protein
MSPDKLSARISDSREITESNEWKETQSLRRRVLDMKIELLNCMRHELGITKGRTFLWKPEHFRK